MKRFEIGEVMSIMNSQGVSARAKLPDSAHCAPNSSGKNHGESA